MTGSDYRPETLAVVAGRPPRVAGASLTPPIHLGVTYIAGGPLGYARDGNATWQALEEAVGALEGGAALAYASGMAAATTVVELLPAGATVVAPTPAYSGAVDLFARRAAAGHLSVRWVDLADSAAVAAACPGADLVWLESPSNPMLDVVDLPQVIAAARAAGALVVVDNTFATPLRQRPLALGADVVLHSGTKLISGHGDVLLGLTVADEAMTARLSDIRHLLGGVPGPQEAWLALRGLRTLPVRLARSEASAAVLAERLAEHPAVSRLRYPGSGTMLAIEVGSAVRATAVCEATRLWAFATSLGAEESTLERRRRWAGEPPGVPEDLIRLSVGLEDVEDLWSDLAAALAATGTV